MTRILPSVPDRSCYIALMTNATYAFSLPGESLRDFCNRVKRDFHCADKVETRIFKNVGYLGDFINGPKEEREPDRS